MANFTALKTAINNAIKTNGNEEITGAVLQVILDAMVETLGESAINDLENAITTEVTNRENAVGDVAADLAAEALARANKDNQLDGRINQEEYNRANADAALSQTINQGLQTLGSQLTALINTEVTNRENAVSGVADDLNAEALARTNKDNQLENSINAEVSNRQNADAALNQTMNQGFQALGSQITALNAAISALNAAYQNGYLYGGIATPLSSPSNNKCFYIALQGGTYTNFGGVGVVEGINIIKNDSGWKVEHIYDQTTLLKEFYLLRHQVIQAITSFAPIVIEGDVTNAPDEEDLTSNANHLLQFKNNAYSPLEFSGLGRKYLRKNIAPLSESAAFNGFVEGVTAEETLSGTPEYIFWDRMNTRFVGIKDGVYYADWTGSENYVPASTSLVYMYQGTPYRWDGSDFSVDEAEVPNLVNCLTQDMINEANTIYIIRYDYTLKEDITIPANCVLEFDGGSISGAYNVTGNNTSIEARLVKIFGTDVTLGGSWDINECYVDWFYGSLADNISQAAQISSIINFTPNKEYYLNNSLIVSISNITLKGNNAILSSSSSADYILKIYANNITVQDLEINGKAVFSDYSKVDDGNFGGILAGQLYDNLYKNIKIVNCHVHHCNTFGIVVTSENSAVSECNVHDIGYYLNAHAFGIAINAASRYYKGKVKSANACYVNNNAIYRCFNGIMVSQSLGTMVKNNNINDLAYIGICSELNSNITIISNLVQNSADNGIDVQECDSVVISNNTIIRCGTNYVETGGVDSGIFVGDDRNVDKSGNTIIEGNLIEGYITDTPDLRTKGSGIYSHHMHNLIICNNIINNIIVHNSGDALHCGTGMYLIHIKNLKTKDNIINTTASYGVYVSVQDENRDPYIGVCTSLKSNQLSNTNGISLSINNFGCYDINIERNILIHTNNKAITVKHNSTNLGYLNSLSIKKNIIRNIAGNTTYDYAIGLVSVPHLAITFNIPIYIENNYITGLFSTPISIDTTYFTFTKGLFYGDYNYYNKTLLTLLDKYPLETSVPDGTIDILDDNNVYVRKLNTWLSAFGVEKNSVEDYFFRGFAKHLTPGTYKLEKISTTSYNACQIDFYMTLNNFGYFVSLQHDFSSNSTKCRINNCDKVWTYTYPFAVYKDGTDVYIVIPSNSSTFAFTYGTKVTLTPTDTVVTGFTKQKYHIVGVVANTNDFTDVDLGSSVFVESSDRVGYQGSNGRVDALGNAFTASKMGATSDRPTNVKVPYCYIDTTIGKPIWWNGTNWVDATGATV
jgi:hypothetical protein